MPKLKIPREPKPPKIKIPKEPKEPKRKPQNKGGCDEYNLDYPEEERAKLFTINISNYFCNYIKIIITTTILPLLTLFVIYWLFTT